MERNRDREGRRERGKKEKMSRVHSTHACAFTVLYMCVYVCVCVYNPFKDNPDCILCPSCSQRLVTN